MKNITIAGIGMGDEGSLTLDAWDAIDLADVVIGGSRIIGNMKKIGDLLADKTCIEKWRPEEICKEIQACEAENIVVLMSGDSGFNSGTSHLIFYMKQNSLWDEVTVKVLPGIGSISNLAATANVGWEESALVSLHGRRQNLYHALASYDKVFVLGGEKTDSVMQALCDSRFSKSEVFIAELMGSEEERILHLAQAEEYESREFDSMTTMLIFPSYKGVCRLCGIEDGNFVRGDVPMTKSEIRAISISRMAIKKNDIIYDIGCGTGSVSIEAAINAPYGKVYAIDKNPEAIALTKKNAESYFCYNIETVEGEAPEICFEKELEVPDVVFVGGSSGHLKDIISSVYENNPMVRVVINAISIETAKEATHIMREYGFLDIEVTQIFSARGQQYGDKHLMIGANPVYVISAFGAGNEDEV